MHRLVPHFIVLLTCSFALSASDPAQMNERLGEVVFPTSCAADVRGSFERGVALLHSFVYEDAEAHSQTFSRKILIGRSRFGGQAMSINCASPRSWTRESRYRSMARSMGPR